MVLSYLKIPLTSMSIDRFASCDNIVPRFQTRRRLVSFPLEETLLQPVLRSIYNEGLESIMKGWKMNLQELRLYA